MLETFHIHKIFWYITKKQVVKIGSVELLKVVEKVVERHEIAQGRKSTNPGDWRTTWQPCLFFYGSRKNVLGCTIIIGYMQTVYERQRRRVTEFTLHSFSSSPISHKQPFLEAYTKFLQVCRDDKNSCYMAEQELCMPSCRNIYFIIVYNWE